MTLHLALCFLYDNILFVDVVASSNGKCEMLRFWALMLVAGALNTWPAP